MVKLKEITLAIFRVALVLGIVYLASVDKDGWGWLLHSLRMNKK